MSGSDNQGTEKATKVKYDVEFMTWIDQLMEASKKTRTIGQQMKASAGEPKGFIEIIIQNKFGPVSEAFGFECLPITTEFRAPM